MIKSPVRNSMICVQRKTLTLLSAGCVAAVSSAAAQQPAQPGQPAQPPLASATVEGVAVDSLHRGFLRGAMLMVEGSNVTAATDSLGRFRLDSIPPGARRIDVIHPLLDSVGISLETKPLTLAAGQKLPLLISVPSAATIVALKCTAAERGLGPAALVGFVQYSESEAPASGATVALEWIDYQISRTSVETVPRRRASTVGANGRFQICGLPEHLEATLTATSGVDTTAAVNVQLGSLLGAMALELPDPQPISAIPAPVASNVNPSPGAGASATRDSSVKVTRVASRVSNAVLTGRVLDRAGAPLSRARVSVDSAYTLSGPDGRFVLRNLRSGTRAVMVRRLGYDPAEVVVPLRARAPSDVTVKLSDFTPVLDTVVVRAAALNRELQRVGFAQRKAAGIGYYLTPQQVADRHASRITDLLEGAPMLRRIYDGGRTLIAGRARGLSAGGCVLYFVDGIQWRGGGVEDFIWPAEVAAVEVYSSNFTPTQFASGREPCETVVIWTKRKVSWR